MSLSTMYAATGEVVPGTRTFTDDEIADVIERAVEHIRRGWMQGALSNEDGTTVCAIGALQLAIGDTPLLYRSIQLEMEARTVIGELLQIQVDKGSYIYDGIVSWNDTAGRTQEEVVEGLLSVVKELRNGSS